MSGQGAAEKALGICAHSYDTPVLETERLVLRPLRLEDAPAIFERWASDPEVTRYMSWNTHRNIDDTLAFLEFEQASLDAPDLFDFGFELKETGELIGSGGITYDEDVDLFMIGYCLMKDCWGKGYATEASLRILDYAVRDLGITDFFSCHATDNPASGNVLMKLGFQYVRDGMFVSADGSKAYPRKEYLLHAAVPQSLSARRREAEGGGAAGFDDGAAAGFGGGTAGFGAGGPDGA